jgi:hypothetical protein
MASRAPLFLVTRLAILRSFDQPVYDPLPGSLGSVVDILCGAGVPLGRDIALSGSGATPGCNTADGNFSSRNALKSE